MTVTVRLPSPEGVAAGQTATLRVPIGNNYSQIWFEYSGVTPAQITQIRTLANGKQIGIYSCEELNKMNAYVGRKVEAGRFCIDFSRKNLRSREQEQLTLMATGTRVRNNLPAVSTLTIQLDIAAGAASPSLKATGVKESPRAPGLIRKLARYNFNIAAIGDFDISDFPKGDAISKIFFINENISKLIVSRDQYTEFERSKALNAQIQEDGFKRDPISGMFVYDTTEEGFGTESLLTRQPTAANSTALGAVIGDLRFTLTTTAVDQNVIAIVESLGFLGA